MKRFLAIARAGEASRHGTWLSGARNFDVLVAYYGDQPGKYSEQAELYDHKKGLKYPWFHAFIERSPWIYDYKAVLLADDDLEADSETLSDAFEIFSERKLWLAQPSLELGSYFSFPMLFTKPGSLLRHTAFVEEQMPIFSRETLHRLRSTFAETVSGWGQAISWMNRLGYPLDRVGVIDAAPVRHVRPLKAGEMYTRELPALGIKAMDELKMMRARYKDDYQHIVLSDVALDPAHPKTPARRARQERTWRPPTTP